MMFVKVNRLTAQRLQLSFPTRYKTREIKLLLLNLKDLRFGNS